jgi:hypothetical protein
LSEAVFGRLLPVCCPEGSGSAGSRRACSAFIRSLPSRRVGPHLQRRRRSGGPAASASVAGDMLRRASAPARVTVHTILRGAKQMPRPVQEVDAPFDQS